MLQTKAGDITGAKPQFQVAEGNRQPILDELNRILEHPLFANSRRYPNLLRHVVDQALAGSCDGLRERTLGVEVFGRDPHYDTNADPIVRTTAVEVRKRLQQYYKAAGRDSPVRIHMPAGSYVPEFIVGWKPAADAVADPPPPPVVGPRSVPNRLVLGATALSLIVLALLTGWAKPWVLPTPLDRFWEPLLSSPNSILICMGGRLAQDLPGHTSSLLPLQISPATTTAEVQQADMVALADATALSRVAGYLQMKVKRYEVRSELSTTFTDLRDAPAVLIGAFNNAWTLRLTQNFRFRYESELSTDGHLAAAWIGDRRNPSAREWRNEPLSPYSGLRADYALISRVLDPETRRWVVVVGGLLKWGTLAAAEFLADPRYMEEVSRRAPDGWQHMNLQIVIGSGIYGGTPGPPRVLATHFW